jgi:prophage maintenance system killer protein
MSEFLTPAEVLAIHQDQIERYGGTHGLRDPGQLEAALFRSQDHRALMTDRIKIPPPQTPAPETYQNL